MFCTFVLFQMYHYVVACVYFVQGVARLSASL